MGDTLIKEADGVLGTPQASTPTENLDPDEEEAATMALSISQVSFEHHPTTALGIGESRPRISWRFEGNASDWLQGGYSLEVTGTGRQENPHVFHVNSSDSVLVPWPTVSLASAEAALVRVRARGADGRRDTPWSPVFSVETGLLDETAWQGAAMIAADKATETDAPHQPVLFRKDLSVGQDVQSARLYITAYGLCEARINGQRVDDAVLAPGWQSYSHRLVYDTYDVSNLLRKGDNAIGIHVGEGWYAGRLGYNGGVRNIYGDTLGAMALLTITTANGTKRSIVTDDSWESGTGAIITSEIYNGERYDTRLEQPGWSSPGFQAAEWIGVKELEAPHGRLRSPDGPPIRQLEEVSLKAVLTSPSGKTILDFGQNLVGWLRLKVKGPSGQTIKLVHVEVLVDGEIATRPLRNATQTDYLTLSGAGVQVWEPTFTYHGFRYVQVEGWPTNETSLDAEAVVAVVVHSDMERTGSLECSDAGFTKLHENIVWSLKGNFMSLPTDCPQRDERLGWTGDVHAFAPTANFLYDAAGFWRGWMRDVNAEQAANKSITPVVVPIIPAASSIGAVAIWGDVVVANPWNSYNASGDLDALRDQYAGAKAWLDFGIPRSTPGGLWNRSVFQYGDWLDPLAPDDDPGAATTSSSLVADAYLVYVTGLVAKMAAALGYGDEESHYAAWADDLKTKFGDAWISPDGQVANETQTGLTLPLYFGLFAHAEQSAAAAGRLDDIIANNSYLVGTGFAGTHLLGLTLSQYNRTETFYRMLAQTAVPSWLYQVTMNATTTWERWDSLEPDGSLNPGEMTSFNHYSVGSVGNWMHQVIGGLAPAEPGWRRVKVNVVPGGNVTWARASYRSPYGTVATDWRVDETGFHLQLTVPPNTRADVTLPGEDVAKTVGSGTYLFEVPGYGSE